MITAENKSLNSLNESLKNKSDGTYFIAELLSTIIQKGLHAPQELAKIVAGKEALRLPPEPSILDLVVDNNNTLENNIDRIYNQVKMVGELVFGVDVWAKLEDEVRSRGAVLTEKR